MKRTIAIIFFLFFFLPLAAEAKKFTDESVPSRKYSWTSKRIESALWGIAKGDVDGDGADEVLFLERKKVLIGNFANDVFKKDAECSLPGALEGARIYSHDIDADGTPEIIVSGVEEGAASSLALEYKDGKCSTVFSHAPWSLRVAKNEDERTVLLGQSWSGGSFFFGPICELSLENGRLKKQRKLELPRYVRLYDFAYLPKEDDILRVAVIKGNEHLEVHEKRGKGFKRIYHSPTRMGGSDNELAAPQRDPLDEENAETVIVATPPVVIKGTDGAPFYIIAPRQDVTLKGVIGRKNYVKSGEILWFAADPAFLYAEALKTIKLSGAVEDYLVDISGKNGGSKLTVLMQDTQGLFRIANTSFVLNFDLE